MVCLVFCRALGKTGAESVGGRQGEKRCCAQEKITNLDLALPLALGGLVDGLADAQVEAMPCCMLGKWQPCHARQVVSTACRGLWTVPIQGGDYSIRYTVSIRYVHESRFYILYRVSCNARRVSKRTANGGSAKHKSTNAEVSGCQLFLLSVSRGACFTLRQSS